MVSNKKNLIIYILYTAVLYFTIYFSITCPPILSFMGIELYLLIILLVIMAMDLNPYYILLVFMLCGYIMDSFIHSPMGSHSLFFIIIIVMIIRFKSIIYKNNFLLRLSYIFFVSFLYSIFKYVFILNSHDIIISIKYLIISPVLTVLIYLLLRFLKVIFTEHIYDIISE